MATHWVCGEFDAESCGGVKPVDLRGIGGQNCLSIFCPLVHVLPTAKFLESLKFYSSLQGMVWNGMENV